MSIGQKFGFDRLNFGFATKLKLLIPKTFVLLTRREL